MEAARQRRPNNDMKKMIACLAIQAVVASASFAQQPPMPPTSSAVSPSAPAPQSGQAARIAPADLKPALCQIDMLISPVDGLPVPASESSLCQPSYSLEALPRFISARGALLDYTTLGDNLVLYYSFRALEMSNVEQCIALRELQDVADRTAKAKPISKFTWESDCHDHYHELSFVKALIMHDAHAAELCQVWNSSDPDESHHDADVPEQCRKMAAATDLGAFSATVCNGSPKQKGKCVDFFRSLTGHASACSKDVTSSHRFLCPGIAAFAKAGPAKNPALCDGNDVCLALTGAAVRASVHISREIAGEVSPVLFKEAAAKLKALDDGLDPLNEAAAKEIDSREERIALLRLKLDPDSRKPMKPLKGAAKEADDAQ